MSNLFIPIHITFWVVWINPVFYPLKYVILKILLNPVQLISLYLYYNILKISQNLSRMGMFNILSGIFLSLVLIRDLKYSPVLHLPIVLYGTPEFAICSICSSLFLRTAYHYVFKSHAYLYLCNHFFLFSYVFQWKLIFVQCILIIVPTPPTFLRLSLLPYWPKSPSFLGVSH